MRNLDWQKSTFSGGSGNGECLQVAAAPDGTLRLRESEDPDTVLTGIPDAYRALLAHIKRGGHAS